MTDRELLELAAKAELCREKKVGQKLPESFVKKGLELAAGATLFGKRFDNMTREELIAAATQGWAAEHRTKQEMMNRSSADARKMLRIP